MHSIDENTSKLNRLGPARRHSWADFQVAEIDTKAELIRALIPLGLMAACDMLEAEVEELVGPAYSRGGARRRHGSNPGSVKLQGQRHAVRVPRVRERTVVMTRSEFPAKYGDHDRFVSRIVREPKIFLIGNASELGKLAEGRAA